jgi:cyclic pyranopterin phosphate synthase
MKLVDTFGRLHNYLRVSLTPKCNMRCSYCYETPEEPKTLDREFLARIIRVFSELGVNKVKLTGGEPLLRRDIPELVKDINSCPNIKHISLTTNGMLLHRYLDTMADNGLKSCSISIDSLVAPKFAFITGQDVLPKVLEAVHRSVKRLETVKVNCVMMKGINDDELLDFVELTRELPIRLRFIEIMPFTKSVWKEDRFISAKDMLARIAAKYTLETQEVEPVAYYYQVKGFVGKVGVIASMSEPFCDKCNRLRITSDGKLKVCLHDTRELQLDPAMNDAEMAAAIWAELQEKKEAHGGMDVLASRNNRSMNSIGG